VFDDSDVIDLDKIEDHVRNEKNETKTMTNSQVKFGRTIMEQKTLIGHTKQTSMKKSGLMESIDISKYEFPTTSMSDVDFLCINS
jgi:hypothetical protein